MAEEQKNTIYNVRVTAEDALKTLAELKLRSQELRDQQKALGKVTEENAQEYYALDSQIKAINSEANKYQNPAGFGQCRVCRAGQLNEGRGS